MPLTAQRITNLADIGVCRSHVVLVRHKLTLLGRRHEGEMEREGEVIPYTWKKGKEQREEEERKSKEEKKEKRAMIPRPHLDFKNVAHGRSPFRLNISRGWKRRKVLLGSTGKRDNGIDT